MPLQKALGFIHHGLCVRATPNFKNKRITVIQCAEFIKKTRPVYSPLSRDPVKIFNPVIFVKVEGTKHRCTIINLSERIEAAGEAMSSIETYADIILV